MTRQSKIQDVLGIVFPSEEFADEAFWILRECIGVISGYDPDVIDITYCGDRISECDAIVKGREALSEIERNTLRYLQEQ